jgi:hypothetical protein
MLTPHGAPVYYEGHRPEQTKLYRLVQRHAATFFAQAEAAAGVDLRSSALGGPPPTTRTAIRASTEGPDYPIVTKKAL